MRNYRARQGGSLSGVMDPTTTSPVVDIGGRRYHIATRALVMGILNRTPDSFFDKGATWEWDAFWARAEEIVSEGADILDVGAVKAGPGPEVSEDEELDRLMPAVEGLVARFDLPVSVDTWRASVAGRRSPPGRSSATTSVALPTAKYLEVAAAAGASVVATHIRLAPRVPDPEPTYGDLVGEVSAFLAERAGWALAAGIPAESVLIDAGLDLGKTAAQSVALLRASRHPRRPRLPPVAFGLEQEVPRRPARPGDKRAQGRIGGRSCPRHHAWVQGGEGSRRPGYLPGAGHAGRHHGGQMSEANASNGPARGEEGAPPAREQGRPRLGRHRPGPGGHDGLAGQWGGRRPLGRDSGATWLTSWWGRPSASLVLEDFSGEELDVAAVAGACQTPPFLADRRVVVLREAGRFNLDQLQPLLSYLEEPLPTTKLVVAGGGGTLPAKFVNGSKSLPGTALVNTDVTGREAHSWVSERIARAPVKLAGRPRRPRSRPTSART